MTPSILVRAKGQHAAEEALRLVRERGRWLATPGGRVLGYEGDGLVVELHTAFAGSFMVGGRDRRREAMAGRGLPMGSATLVVRDGWLEPALVAAVGDRMEIAGVARFRDGPWVHEVAACLAGIPAFVVAEDADDLRAAVDAVREVACGLWRPDVDRGLYLGVFMSPRSLWSHAALLPLVLAEAADGCGDLEVDAGETLTQACVKRFRVADPEAFETALRGMLGSWHVYRDGATADVTVGLEKGRDLLDAEMRRLGIGNLSELEVRVALAVPV